MQKWAFPGATGRRPVTRQYGHHDLRVRQGACHVDRVGKTDQAGPLRTGCKNKVQFFILRIQGAGCRDGRRIRDLTRKPPQRATKKCGPEGPHSYRLKRCFVCVTWRSEAGGTYRRAGGPAHTRRPIRFPSSGTSSGDACRSPAARNRGFPGHHCCRS